ncbi:hypothetical protein [Palaeococcus ferrophilus]|uniref:hypothetical protein n=1 Tax=Palaeococcus ferrophilus TaxID=83868 RepID=UPI00064E98F4|nr:hypothetical protein [Palaeococcus ferrophilus]
MRETIVSLVLLFLVFSSACIGYGENRDTDNPLSHNNLTNSLLPLTDVPRGVIELGTLAKYGNITVMRATYGYVISKNGTKAFLNVSKAYFFPWGFVVVEKAPALRKVPLVRANLTTIYSESSQNTTAVVETTRIKAYDYEGNPLWVHETQPPYIWELIGYGKKAYEKNVSYPRILISNNSGYFFIAELPRHLGNTVNLPASVKGISNSLYIYGSNGLLEQFNISGRYEVDNGFLLSAGNYTVFGFQVTFEDGTPNYGEVLVFQGSKLIFRKRFERNPECLCNVIHGWARIYPDGCVLFGLLEGTGFYCKGNFKYTPKENG